jgi:hypothetical protein
MDFCMGKKYDMMELFKVLSLENQETLLACARVSRTAENAVKKAFSGQRPCDADVSGGNRGEAFHGGRGAGEVIESV